MDNNEMYSADPLAEIEAKLRAAGIDPQEIEETFIQASGPGGQKVNKSAACVALWHRTTGIRVRCQQSRLQGANRVTARRLLLEKVLQMRQARVSAERMEREKLRRQSRKPSRAAKARMFADKARRQVKKRLRSRPGMDY